MIFSRVFLIGLSWRVAGLVAACAAIAALSVLPGYHAATLVVSLVAAGVLASLWRYVQRTNLEVARFVDALTYADFSASFGHKHEGFGFEQLGGAMNTAVERLREQRSQTSDTNRMMAALVDEVPTPLFSVDIDGQVELLNKAARRMFSVSPVVRVADFKVYGEQFAVDAVAAEAGERHTTQLVLDEIPQTATLLITEVRQPAKNPLRLVAVQPIQGELDHVEMMAWRDLVRVLTHEIMNSVTPITSLARTAADVIDEVDSKDPRVADARAAIETVARRADGVMHFVQTYRQISRAPPLRRQQFLVKPMLEELGRLFAADWPTERVAFTSRIDPQGLEMFADPDLISQVLINLLRNAAEAATETAAAPEVRLSVHRNRHGRTVMEIRDNGAGVPVDRVDEIFLPFFTTKSGGTGVGLSLARQIILAHGGSLGLAANGPEGATFRLVC